MGNYRIAVIPGDGIGREVISSGVQVLEELARTEPNLSFEFEHLPWGSELYLEKGHMIPDGGVESLKSFDSIFFGSAGDPRVPDHISLWQLRLAICQGLDQYANIRPAKLLPGLTSPLRDVRESDIDWIIVRENSEGEYSGIGGRVHHKLPLEVGVDVSLFTGEGCERIQRFALELAASRPRKSLILVTKSNAQRHGMVFWDEIFEKVRHDYPAVKTERVLVDAMAARFITDPSSIDVVVATNLHADILSDLAAALSGSLGLAPTGNINPERNTPSMFEPIHGSAFDITGRGIANPLGAIWSSALMLETLGEHHAANRIMNAVSAVTREGSILPRDLGGQARTEEITKSVCNKLYQ